MVIVAIVTALSALAATGSALFAGLSLRQQAKAADVYNYLVISERLLEAERRLVPFNSDSEDCRRIYIEHLNLLECYAKLHNEERVGATSRDLLKDALLNQLLSLEFIQEINDLIEGSVTGKEAFEEIRSFWRETGMQRIRGARR